MGFPTYDKPSLADLIAQAPDLGEVKAALIREDALRHVMAETGESREVVTSVIASVESMEQEAVLDLTDGEPTTLQNGLARYIQVLEGQDEILPRDGLLTDLNALLLYPWPGEGGREAEAVCVCMKDAGGLRYPASHPANLDRGINCPVHPRSAAV